MFFLSLSLSVLVVCDPPLFMLETFPTEQHLTLPWLSHGPITVIKYIVWRFVLKSKTIMLDSNYRTSRKSLQDKNTFATTLHSLAYCRWKFRSHPTPISFRICTCLCLCHVLESINIIQSFPFKLIDPWHEKAVIQVKWTRYFPKMRKHSSLFSPPFVHAWKANIPCWMHWIQPNRCRSFFFDCGTDNREVGLSKKSVCYNKHQGSK